MSLASVRHFPVCVAHLVRQLNGVEPLRRFLAAYRRFDGGLEHDLLLLCKGFEGERLPPEYLEALAEHRYRTIYLNDEGFDIAPYFAAVRATDYPVYCFLNSFSEPLDPAWLRKLHAGLQAPGVGLVGATGSWASLFSLGQLQCRRRSAYDGLFPADVPPTPPAQSGLGWVQAVRHQLGIIRYLARLRRQYAPFPAAHIRSNAFMMRRETMLTIKPGTIQTKEDALNFESGRRSLTAQVRSAGLAALVVGRDGAGYPAERWPESETFWQADQGNLLVADNQTLDYARGDRAHRRFRAAYAWGARGRSETSGSPPL